MKNFKKAYKIYLLQSSGLHILFLFLGVSFVFIRPYIFNLQKNQIRIIQAAVKVDLVEMPKFTIKELRTMETLKYIEKEEEIKEIKKVIVKKPSDAFLKKVKKKSLKDLLGNISKKRIERRRTHSTKKKKKDLAELSSTKLKALLNQGNKLSQGVVLTGEGSESDLTEFDRYNMSLVSKVREYWKLPSYLKDRSDLKTGVRIFIAPDGSLKKMSLYQSSGVKEFDQLALEAVRKSAPFSPPSSAFIRKKALRGEIILGFPL